MWYKVVQGPVLRQPGTASADPPSFRPERTMRILGIDPGLRITGYGVVDYRPFRPKLVDGGVIRLKPKTSLADRLVEVEIELDALLEEHKPDVCAVEQLYSHYA